MPDKNSQVGDYDGNGTTDLAVFRPSNGTWYVRNTSLSSVTYGTNGDIPVPGDYDGNGTTDLAVFRPSNGTWYVRNGNPSTVAFGTNGDIPVPGDYDGNGITDLAVFRPSNGTWYVRNTGPGSVAYATKGDIPVFTPRRHATRCQSWMRSLSDCSLPPTSYTFELRHAWPRRR